MSALTQKGRAVGGRLRNMLVKPESLGVEAETVLRSAVASRHDELGAPSERLLDLLEKAIPIARRTSLDDICERITAGVKWPEVWPGEHYRLLTALVDALGAREIIEIGTYQGLGTLSLERGMPAGGRIATFDIVPWQEVPGCVLRPDDFGDRITQFTDDITTAAGWELHQPRFRNADLIFVDSAHDGIQERVIMARFESVGFERSPIVILDDIRWRTLLQLWRDVSRPKLDVTSLGHWSGTGLIDFA